MSDNTAAFTKLMPGFDFLQGLVKNAGSALPNIGQWVAPTLDPEELDKRIEELRTVQFWLEQNAKMLGATIQALEVQRMTLSTLKTMNVQMSDLRESMKLPQHETAAAQTQPQAGVVDPMQWWGALTKQFTQLAAGAMKEGGGNAAATIVKQGFDAAEQALKPTAKSPAKAKARARKSAPAKASKSGKTPRR